MWRCATLAFRRCRDKGRAVRYRRRMSRKLRPLGHPVGTLPVRSAPDEPSAEHLRIVESVGRRIEASYALDGAWIRGYLDGHARRLAQDLAEVERVLPQGATVLDVGACPPVLVGGLCELGRRAIGVDIDPRPYAGVLEELGIEVSRCNIETEPLPFDSGSVEAVVCSEVFEHLRLDLLHTLSEMSRVLASGGRLMLCTPNLTSLAGMANLLMHGRAYSLAGDIYTEYANLSEQGFMGHVREYTPAEVIDLLERFDLRVIEVVYRGSYRRIGRYITRVAPIFLPRFELVAEKL